MLAMIAAMLLAVFMLADTTEAYALETQSVNSWSELESAFKTSDNTITIPKDTNVIISKQLIVPSGSYTITGTGSIQRGEISDYGMFRLNDGANLTIENIHISGQPTRKGFSDFSIYGGSLILNNVTVNQKLGTQNIIYLSSGSIDVSECIFEDNISTGSLVYMGSKTTTANIVSTKFINNTPSCIEMKPGISSNIKIEGCTLKNNKDSEIIMPLGSVGSVTINSCDITGSSEAEADSWGIYSKGSTSIDMNGCTINRPNGNGIYSSEGDISLTGCDLAGQKIELDATLNITGGEVASLVATRITIKDAKITDSIETSSSSVNISGSVNITATLNYYSQGYYNIVDSLSKDAYISVSGSLIPTDLSGYYEDEYTNSYRIATADHKITQEEVNAFAINQDISQWREMYNDLSKYNIYLGEQLSSLDIYDATVENEIIMWNGPDLRPDPGDGDDQDPTTPSNPGETEGNLTIWGTVNPINMIDVTVPLTIEFIIESDRTFTGPDDITITSNCPSPLDVILYGVNKSEEAPALVAPTTYDDNGWNNLSRADTRAKMALMLSDTSLTDTSATLGRINSAFVSEQSLSLDLAAKYGKAWDNSEDLRFTYNVVFEFAMP